MATASHKENKIRTLRKILATRNRELLDITQRSGYGSINQETLDARSRCRDIHFKIKELTGSRCINVSSDGGDSDSSGSRTPMPSPVGPRPPTEPTGTPRNPHGIGR